MVLLIKCRSNVGADLPASCLDERRGYRVDTVFPVTVGKLYVVYALTVHLANIWYYILDDDGHEWPTWRPGPLFDVEDGRLPRGWKVGYFRFDSGDQFPVISFPEWADDHTFYERLVDGDTVTREIFARRKLEIDRQLGDDEAR